MIRCNPVTTPSQRSNFHTSAQNFLETEKEEVPLELPLFLFMEGIVQMCENLSAATWLQRITPGRSGGQRCPDRYGNLRSWSSRSGRESSGYPPAGHHAIPAGFGLDATGEGLRPWIITKHGRHRRRGQFSWPLRSYANSRSGRGFLQRHQGNLCCFQ